MQIQQRNVRIRMRARTAGFVKAYQVIAVFAVFTQSSPTFTEAPMYLEIHFKTQLANTIGYNRKLIALYRF